MKHGIKTNNGKAIDTAKGFKKKKWSKVEQNKYNKNTFQECLKYINKYS